MFHVTLPGFITSWQSVPTALPGLLYRSLPLTHDNEGKEIFLQNGAIPDHRLSTNKIVVWDDLPVSPKNSMVTSVELPTGSIRWNRTVLPVLIT